MSSNPIQYVTLVSGGGTPVRIADQKGSPYPTTGHGALVFNINPTIEGGLTVNGDLTYSGNLIGPYNSPLTTQGDLYYYGPTGNTRLPLGAAGTTLVSDGNNAIWRAGGATPGGAAGGDLDGTYPNPVLRPSLTNGQVMTTLTGTAQWANLPAGNPGTVTTISVASANGLAGTVATPTSTPAITLSTTVTGLLKGNGTAISAATAGTDYVTPGGLPTTLPPSGAAGGDLSGTYPNPTVKSAAGAFAVTGPLTGTTATFSTSVSSPSGAFNTLAADTIITTPDVNQYALQAGRYSAGFGKVALNTRGAYGWAVQVNGVATLDIDSGLVAVTGQLQATTIGVNGAAGLAKFRSQGADGDLLGLFSGTTKGLRITTTVNGAVIQGVDTTGVGSFQPLELFGTVVNAPTPTAGTNDSQIATTAFVQSALPTSLPGPPTGTAGGDLSGTYPNPTIKPSVTNGQVLTTVAGVAAWAAASGGGGASVTVSDTAPGSPTSGALWWNSTLGVMFIWYTDPDTSQWVPVTPTVSGVGSFLPLGGGTLTGGLIGTTATFSGGDYTLKRTGSDTAVGVLFAGATKGIRFGHDGGGSTIQGVDNTGIGSFQPLRLNGSVVTLETALTGMTATFSGALSADPITTNTVQQPAGNLVLMAGSGFTTVLGAGAASVYVQGGAAMPAADNAITLGQSTFRWSDVRAVTATFTNTISTNGFTAGYLEIPQQAQTTSYTAVLADSGKHLYHAVAAAAATYTIPSNASVAYPLGATLTFVNDSANAVTIAITTDTLVLSPGTTTGSRTLATGGVATAIKVTSTRWIINGTGLT